MTQEPSADARQYKKGRKAVVEKIAYNMKEAAEAAGVSVSTLRRAIANNDLIANYPTASAVILKEELQKWIKATPTESPRGTHV